MLKLKKDSSGKEESELPLTDSKLPLPRVRHLGWNREKGEGAILGGRQQWRLASAGKSCRRYFPGKQTRLPTFGGILTQNLWGVTEEDLRNSGVQSAE